MAILAGDALLSLSFEYIARETKNVPADRVLRVIVEVSGCREQGWGREMQGARLQLAGVQAASQRQPIFMGAVGGCWSLGLARAGDRECWAACM